MYIPRGSAKIKTKIFSTTFVCVPNPILKHPPIGSVFDGTIMLAIMDSARFIFERQRRRRARKDGKKAGSDRARVGREIACHKRAYEEFGVKDIMSDGYWLSFANSQPSDVTIVIVSPWALLREAGLSCGGKNLTRLDAALRRLRRPVQEMPALLLGVERLASGKLRLAVSGKWVKLRRFGRVPMPVPTKSAITWALYLFAYGSDQRPESNTNSISIEELCRRIGISATRPSHKRRALVKALASVNKHIAEKLDQTVLGEAKPPLAVGFEIEWLEYQRVRIAKAAVSTEATVAAEAMDEDNVPDDADADDAGAAATQRKWWQEHDRRCVARLHARLNGGVVPYDENDLPTFLAKKLRAG